MPGLTGGILSESNVDRRIEGVRFGSRCELDEEPEIGPFPGPLCRFGDQSLVQCVLQTRAHEGPTQISQHVL